MTPKQPADVGNGVTMIGRWHGLAGRRGVHIMQATKLAALNRYPGPWNPYKDVGVAPVLDDGESAKAAKSMVADNCG